VPFEYHPEEFWTAHGPNLAPPGTSSPEQSAVLKELGLLIRDLEEIISVIDVGCGQGRLAAFIAEVLPNASYSGVDLAQAQLDGTARVQPEGEYYLSKLQDFQPGLKWDLVLCSEVLMHIPPNEMHLACQNLLAITGKYLITIDWTRPLTVKTAPWNWLHAYREFLGEPDVEIPSGNQSIFLFTP